MITKSGSMVPLSNVYARDKLQHEEILARFYQMRMSCRYKPSMYLREDDSILGGKKRCIIMTLCCNKTYRNCHYSNHEHSVITVTFSKYVEEVGCRQKYLFYIDTLLKN